MRSFLGKPTFNCTEFFFYYLAARATEDGNWFAVVLFFVVGIVLGLMAQNWYEKGNTYGN